MQRPRPDLNRGPFDPKSDAVTDWPLHAPPPFKHFVIVSLELATLMDGFRFHFRLGAFSSYPFCPNFTFDPFLLSLSIPPFFLFFFCQRVHPFDISCLPCRNVEHSPTVHARLQHAVDCHPLTGRNASSRQSIQTLR